MANDLSNETIGSAFASENYRGEKGGAVTFK
jgi:hypothetical protein